MRNGLILIITSLLIFTACRLEAPPMSEFRTHTQTRDSSVDWPHKIVIHSDNRLVLGDEQATVEPEYFHTLKIEYVDQDGSSLVSEVPDRAVVSVNRYFRLKLEICMEERADPISDSQKRLQEGISLGREAADTIAKLRLHDVDTPFGRRRISEREAGELIRYAGVSAADACRSHSLD